MNKNNIIKILFAALLLLSLGACREMDDNYEKYLETEIYAAKVANLQVTNSLREVNLTWTNPADARLDHIVISYDDVEIATEGMVTEKTISDLELKGYTFTVKTVDKSGNKSIPVSVFAFPNGE